MRDRWFHLISGASAREPIELMGSDGQLLLSGYGNRKIRHMEWSAKTGGVSNPAFLSVTEPHPLLRAATSLRLTVTDADGNTTISFIHLQDAGNLGSAPYGLYTDPSGTYRDVLVYDRDADHPLKIKRRCKVLVLNGMENWITPESDPTRHVLYLSDCKKTASVTDPSTVGCTYLLTKTYSEISVGTSLDAVSNSSPGAGTGGIMIRYASNESISGEEAFRNFLGGKADREIPVTVVYPLAEEVTEYVTLSDETKALLKALDSSDKTIQIMDNVNDKNRSKYVYCSNYETGFSITSKVSGFRIKF